MKISRNNLTTSSTSENLRLELNALLLEYKETDDISRMN